MIPTKDIFILSKCWLWSEGNFGDALDKYQILSVCPFVRLSVGIMPVVNIPLIAKLKLSTSNLAEPMEVLAQWLALKTGQIGRRTL